MVGLILLVFLLPAVVGLCRSLAGTKARIAVVGVWLSACLLVGWAAQWYEEDRSSATEVAERPVEHREEGYLSSRNCKACHPHEHATWDSSYHPRMTDLVAPERVVGDFGVGEITVEGKKYLLERVGDEFWAEFSDPDAADEGGESRIRKRLVMSTGSHHMQIYWYETGEGRTMGQLPIIYLKEAKRWIPRGAAFIEPPNAHRKSETGQWNTNCIACHTTGHKPGMLAELPSPGDTTRVAEFGIGCEACHGPGSEHARLFRNPGLRYARHRGGEKDPHIVNPAGLDHARSAEVCGQCHGVSQERSEGEYRAWLKDGRRYRPGDKLSDSILVVSNANRTHPEFRELLAEGSPFWENRFWPDGMVKVSGREYNGLIETPCFQGGEMSCLSCHTMHQRRDDLRPSKQWANDQLAHDRLGNKACTQCHEEYRDGPALAAHSHHLVHSAGSQCTSCHMPHTTYGLLKAIPSHQIDSPDVRVEVDTGRPNACNLCHLDKSLAWSGERLQEWYGIEKPANLSSDQKEVAYGIERLTRGDAGQRALIGWSMGWAPAQEAAGTSWMAPYLGLLLDDPYRAVRYIGARSLRTLPGFREHPYDFLAPEEERATAHGRVLAAWGREREKRGGAAEPQGIHVDVATLRRLLGERDNKPMLLNE